MRDFHYRRSWYSFRPARPDRPHVIRWIEHDDTGRRHTPTRSFPTKRAALAFQRIIDDELNRALSPGAAKAWDELIREYDAYLAQHSRSYRYFVFRALASFHAVLKPRRLSDIGPAACDRYFAEFQAGRVPAADGCRTWSIAQAQQDHVALRAFFQLWVERAYITSNPMATLNKPRSEATIIITPSADEWINLLTVIPYLRLQLEDPQAWHLLILLAAATGIDRDDLLKITLQPVKPPNWTPFRFRLGTADTDQLALLAGRRSKTRGVRLHGLPRVVSDRLAVRVDQLPPGSNYLFPWRTFQRKQWDRIRQAAAFGFRFRDLRAAAGTQQAEAAALQAGADLLGHSDSAVTRRHYVAQQRLALALAKRLDLPELPPLPDYRPPGRVPGKPGRIPRSSESSGS